MPRGGWNKRRLQVCPDCGKSRSVRADSDAVRCVPCAVALSMPKALKARYKKTPRKITGCHHCGREFACSRAKFCSKECYSRSQTIVRRIKPSKAEWRPARKEALQKNPFCAVCGTFKNLHVHHIIPYRLSQDNDQKNLIPLCGKHHTIVEKLYLRTEDVERRADLLWYRIGELREIQNITRARLTEVIGEVYGKAA